MLASVALVAVLAATLLSTAGGGYEIRARFTSAGQLVKGNQVKLAGRPVGRVPEVGLTRQGVAEVTLEISDERVAPLPAGTRAEIRTASLSGIANRYVELRLPGGPTRGVIPNGGLIDLDRTQTTVDLDQVFNLFDAPTRRGLRRLVRGFGASYRDRSEEANASWEYLSPAFVAGRRLFSEVGRDAPVLQRFLDHSGRLMSDLAARRRDLSRLVDRMAIASGAIAEERQGLADAIAAAPPFMRQANTTFVNVRATLDELDPLISALRPAAPRLRALFSELRPLARDATPTLGNLSRIVRSPGRLNDLIDVGKATLPYRRTAVGPVRANGRERPGSFKAAEKAFSRSLPVLAHLRPYVPEITSWFDDFAHNYMYDANGQLGRAAAGTSAFTLLNGALRPVPPELRPAVFERTAQRQTRRCPGALERDPGDGSTPWRPGPGFQCDSTQVPLGR